MGNCLVKKLLENVNDDNLPRLGELLVRCGGGTSETQFMALSKQSDIGLNIHPYEGGVYTNAAKTVPYEEITTGISDFNVYVDEDSLLGFNPKSIMKKLSFHNLSFMQGGLNTLKNLPLLEILVINSSSLDANTSELPLHLTRLTILYSTGIVGSFSDIGKITTLEDLWIRSVLIEGDIVALGTLVELTSLNLDSCYNCYGTLESFVQKQRQNGRLTNANGIEMGYCVGVRFTFNGESITGSYNKKLTWTETTITLSRIDGTDAITVNA